MNVKKFQLYFEYEMAIFGGSEASKPQDPVVVTDENQSERPDQPLSKFKVWSTYYLVVINSQWFVLFGMSYLLVHFPLIFS